MTATTPYGLTRMARPRKAWDSGLSQARLCPTDQIAYLDGRPLYVVAPLVAAGTGNTNPDGKDAIAVDTDNPSD